MTLTHSPGTCLRCAAPLSVWTNARERKVNPRPHPHPTLSSQKVAAVSKAARTMKLSLAERDDKYKWQVEWSRLCGEEERLTEELHVWMGQNRGLSSAPVPLPPRARVGHAVTAAVGAAACDNHDNVNDGAAVPPRSPLQAAAAALEEASPDPATPAPTHPQHDDEPLVVEDLLSLASQAEYGLSLERNELRDRVKGVRGALLPLLAHFRAEGPQQLLPLPKGERERERGRARARAALVASAREGLHAAVEAMDALWQEVLGEAAAADEVAALSQAAVARHRAVVPNPADGGGGGGGGSGGGSGTDGEQQQEGAEGGDPPTPPHPSRAVGPTVRRAQCASLLAEAGGRDCEDPALRTRLFEGLVALQRRYEEDCAALDEDFAGACEDCGTTAQDETGGWSRDAHLAFLQGQKLGSAAPAAAPRARAGRRSSRLRVDRADDEEGGVGNGRGRGEVDDEEEEEVGVGAGEEDGLLAPARDRAISNLVGQVTGGRDRPSPLAVRAHSTWYAARRTYLARRSARDAQWARERDEFVSAARGSFAAAAELAAHARRRAAASAAHERVRQESHARLEGLRARKAVEDAATAAIQAELDAAEGELALVAEESRRARADGLRAALASYRAEIAENERLVEAVRREAEALAQERRRAEVAAGAERVEARREHQAEVRAARAAALAEQAAALDADRAALVERLLAAVPYRERLEEIATTADAGRAHGHTAASKAAADLSLAYAAYLRAVLGGGGGGGGGAGEDGGTDPTAYVSGATTHGDFDLAGAAKLAGKAGGAGGATPGAAAAARDSLLTLANTRIREKGLFARAGFSERQVTSDKRWRLVQGAWASGVQGTSAARDALTALQPMVRGGLAAARSGAETSGAW
jgi:hypothetical protein